MFVIADVAAGPAIVLFGLVIGGLFLLTIALVEALVLWRLQWGSFGRSLRDSLIVNLGSGLVGVLLSIFASDLWQVCGYDPARGGRWCEQLISPWILLVGAWLLSVLIEGTLLMLLAKHPARKIWASALAINVVSYSIIGALALLAGDL
ncbi:MAG: hypothetical protein ACJ8CR_19910 [Roseiflexaceae bacterium]